MINIHADMTRSLPAFYPSMLFSSLKEQVIVLHGLGTPSRYSPQSGYLYTPDDCVFDLPPFPKFGFRSLQAATTCGSICGKALVACVRCGVPNMIGWMQSDIIPEPLFVPLGTKPACEHAAAILAQGCQGTG
jgi:hypothetical protein